MPPEQTDHGLPFLAEPAGIARQCGQSAPAADRTRTDETRSFIEGGGTQDTPERHALSSTAVDLVAERFRILGEPLRVRIIQELQAGERSVSEIAEAVGASQPNVSKHLRIIQNGGIAGRRHDGNLVRYFITDKSVLDLCDAVCSSIGEKLAHDASIAVELHGGITGRK